MSKSTKDIVGEYPVIIGNVSTFGIDYIHWRWMKTYKVTTYKSFMRHEHFEDMKQTISILIGNNYGANYTSLG